MALRGRESKTAMIVRYQGMRPEKTYSIASVTAKTEKRKLSNRVRVLIGDEPVGIFDISFRGSDIDPVTAQSMLMGGRVSSVDSAGTVEVLLARERLEASRNKGCTKKNTSLTKQSASNDAWLTQMIQPLLPSFQSLTSPGAQSFLLAKGDRTPQPTIAPINM